MRVRRKRGRKNETFNRQVNLAVFLVGRSGAGTASATAPQRWLGEAAIRGCLLLPAIRFDGEARTCVSNPAGIQHIEGSRVRNLGLPVPGVAVRSARVAVEAPSISWPSIAVEGPSIAAEAPGIGWPGIREKLMPRFCSSRPLFGAAKPVPNGLNSELMKLTALRSRSTTVR